MTTALIDGDILIYKIACAVEQEFRWPDGVWTYAADENKGIKSLKNLLENWEVNSKCDSFFVCISDPVDNFRKHILPTYKGNRTSLRKPLILDFLRQWCEDNLPVIMHNSLEADDIMGIYATNGTIKDPVIVTTDKDLQQIPVKIYNPDQGKWSSPDHRDGNLLHMMQTLTGDVVDGYTGCKGVGAVTAQKALSKSESPKERWEIVKSLFLKNKMTEEDALQQARVAYILQGHNYTNEEIKLWG